MQSLTAQEDVVEGAAMLYKSSVCAGQPDMCCPGWLGCQHLTGSLAAPTTGVRVLHSHGMMYSCSPPVFCNNYDVVFCAVCTCLQPAAIVFHCGHTPPHATLDPVAQMQTFRNHATSSCSQQRGVLADSTHAVTSAEHNLSLTAGTLQL